MKINSPVANNTNFNAINKNKINFNNFSKIKSSIKNDLNKDEFVKLNSNKKNFKNLILDFFRNNEKLFQLVIPALLGVGLVFSNIYVLLGTVLLSIANLRANSPFIGIFKHDNTVINPTSDKNLTESQKYCKSIFLENYTNEDSINISKKYKQIFDIKDKKEFISLTFANLKKDYNLEKIPIKLVTDYKKTIINGMESNADMHFDTQALQFVVRVSEGDSKKSLLKSLTHEMHHIKQNVIMHQTSKNNEERLNAKKSFVQDIFKTFDDDMADFFVRDYVEKISKVLERCGYKENSIKEGQPFYDYGRKILEDSRLCALKSKAAYLNSFREIDAIRSAEMMIKLIK